MHAFAASFTTLLALLGAVNAAPVTLFKRNCNGSQMPSKPDAAMRDIIYKTVLANGGNDHVMLATMSAAITESFVNNLECGDKDSLGLFQQRPSQGWGSRGQILDPVHSTESFLNVLIPLEKKNPNTDAGVLAQMVQNAEAGNQYTKNEGLAKQLIAQAKASVGGSAPAPSSSKPAPKPTSTPAPKPTSSSSDAPAPAPTSTAAPETPINTAPAPPSDDDSDDEDCDADDSDDNDDEDCDDSDDDSEPTASASVPINVAPAPTAAPATGSCAKFYTPKSGDNCYKLADMFGIKLAQLYKLNPQIDSQCHNLQVNQQYCVDSAAASA